MKKVASSINTRIFVHMIILGSLFAMSSVQTFGTIRTVDNNYPRIGQFSTLQEAHDAASNGDTIYVYPSQKGYTGITVTKRIILIGTGFGIPQANVQRSHIGNMTFDPGSQNSIIEGFDGNFQLIINENYITAQRNKIGGINLKSGHLGNIISRNLINYIDIENQNEVIFKNNIIITTFKICIFSYTSNSSIILDYNVLRHNYAYGDVLQLGGSNLKMTNCILLQGHFNGVNTSESFNNICNSNQLSSVNGNIPNINMAEVFVDPENNDFHLKPGSPAIGTGLNGTDMGIYGGVTPFVDGRYPDIPAIYFLDVPLNAKQKEGINVIIKAKTNQ